VSVILSQLLVSFCGPLSLPLVLVNWVKNYFIGDCFEMQSSFLLSAHLTSINRV